MNFIISCRIAWAIAGQVGAGEFDTDIATQELYRDIGNYLSGPNTHKLQCWTTGSLEEIIIEPAPLKPAAKGLVEIYSPS